ncbi:hypothetical protein HYQ45_011439 [Verticillium longisporum]|uniref:Uncharacterized protein n=2 Tax=Verticillium longisporum TaxID=100787 RepID=A0A0G4M937_VERLO|nr:hypothetical protein HYQ44_006095 [Verticillium longisporum]KAG7129415.1 hypothetical protein HYQ45_011439 [Verticillium longisporum]CRK30475.1 hypothetical protein BN1708_000990 [Verticillium longisporum]
MVSSKVVALVGAFFASSTVAQATTSNEMGAAAFLWPADRKWVDATDETAPCGGAQLGERTAFPLTNGRLALVTQDNTRAVHVGVSYSNNPTSASDFETFYGPDQVGALDLGHTCITVPDHPASVTAGSNATYRILYVANFEENEADRTTHYACADVEFVEFAAFDEEIPCFNSTISDPEVKEDGSVSVTTTDENGKTPHTVEDFTASEDKGLSGLAGGEIAGVVVGVVAGLGLLAALAFFLVRRKNQKKQATEPMREVDVEKVHSDTLSTRS